MTKSFVKTETVTVKEVVSKIDVDGPGGCYMSVEKVSSDLLEIVVGAPFKKRCAALFSKKTLKELIDTLQEIHDTL